MKLSSRAFFALSVLLPVLGSAQSKKPLTQDTYDIWRQIQAPTLSPDGRWAVYTLTPVVGDGEVVARATEGAGTEFRSPRGWTGRPITSVQADSPFSASPAQITADSRHVIFLAYAPKREFDEARAQKRPASEQPRASLGIMSLRDGRVTTIERVRSFRLPEKSGRYVVYLTEPARDSASAASERGGDSTRARGPRRQYGSPLVIRDLSDGKETQVADVSSYVVDDSARFVAYAVTSRISGNDGVYVRDLASGQTTTLLKGQGDYRQLIVDEAGTQLAFVTNRAEFGATKPRFVLYHASIGAGEPTQIVAAGSVDGLSPSDRGRTEFTRNGNALIFSVTAPPADTIPADSLADKAVLDLWHWKDDRLQPQQQRELNRDRSRSWLAIYKFDSRKALRLANDTMPNVTVSDDGSVALTVTNVPYAVESMWGDGGSDVYVTDIASGRTTPVARKLEFGAQLSPAGRYVTYFDNKQWNVYDIANGTTASLTGALAGVRFDQETHDSPSTAPAWGIAGWTRDDQQVLIYDRYDIWEIDPRGQRPTRVLTDSAGVRGHLQLRLVDLDPDERFIDPSKTVLLRAFNEETKGSGFYRDRLDRVSPPELIAFGDRNYGTPRKAKNAERYLLTQQTVAEFPNLWSGSSLTELTRISDANPQQKDYPWPTVDLVSWVSDDGIPLKGLLYKPEGFDPSRQYPMIVYYYEILSDGLHNYHAPAGRNTINPTVYTSLGYLVFFPDIVYEVGWPGPSSVKAVLPGVQSLIARGFVNPKAIGIAGQSWGGYQSAYIITQTSMFAAAVPNAPVANMTSAYGGIRWESGRSRTFQYEKTQSRIGGSLWEAPVRYIENSPLFHLDRVTTPVLFMHNDGDGAVPWYQGIELFVGLRRLGKEVYMVNYNGDGHNPRKRANQKDIDRRMQEFFATKLKGAQPPDWMVRGIPYIDKGRDQIVH